MAGGELKLLSTWASPWACRVRIALHLKDLSYDYVEEDLENKSDLLLASNPVFKKVPVLIHDGKPISESQVIVQYIDEAFASNNGSSLLPSDPHERATARFCAAYIDDKLVAAWVQAFRGKTEEEKLEGRKQMLMAVETVEGALRECSKGKPFFRGDSVGYLDVMLGGLLSWLHGTEALCGAEFFDAAKTPLLLAWAERFGALDAAKAVLPDVGRLVEFAKMRPGGDELKLLSTWFSPFGSRVKLALHLKGLSYEYVEEDLMNKSQLLLESNPVHKKVPVLFHRGKALCESMVIVHYIEEAFPDAGPSLLPSDPYERAIARFWVAFIENKFVAPWLQLFEGAKTGAEKAEGLKHILAARMTMEGALEECCKSKGKPFFGGDSVGCVDIALGGLLVWVRASEVLFGVKFFDAARTPLLSAWAERFAALDAAKAALPDFGRVLEYAMMVRGPVAGAVAANN
ncbi:putative glutathione S-transferase GSTU6 [Dichanthelium oligosanthes]|uniref:glutathione transferase n=1 Tax=Dichanthelium oligosanthes TaxID=888268 RepID=A0A1E5V931_9POAL|nr:putative glutathione S-transferase GSTU6 [Dichanthelium oligosanthes]